jgi:ubiquinone/menaquinone biosynthesis C-methylase UbiE
MAETEYEVIEESKYKEKVKKYYADKVESMTSENPFFDVKLRILKESCRPWYDVLDAGCGNGNFGLEIAQGVKTLCGCDLTIEMLEYFARRARQRGTANLTLATADLTNLPFKNSQFDLIYSYSTLYYIREIEEVLSEFHRVTKPGGNVILELATNYNIQAWHSRLRFDCPHFFLAPVEIDRLVCSSGFRITGKRYFNLVPTFLRKGFLEHLYFKPVQGRTFDEWISSKFIFKNFAFKVILFGTKA